MLNCPVKACSGPSHDLKCSESAWAEVSRQEIKSVLPLFSALWIRPCVLSNLDLQIDYSSNLFCASSIVLSSIKCHSWRSIFQDSWVCVKRQNHKPVLSFRENIHFKWRIITLSHWLFLYEPPQFYSWTWSCERAGQEPHWSQSHRWLILFKALWHRVYFDL